MSNQSENVKAKNESFMNIYRPKKKANDLPLDINFCFK